MDLLIVFIFFAFIQGPMYLIFRQQGLEANDMRDMRDMRVAAMLCTDLGFDRVPPELTQWLIDATRGLCEGSKERIALEIGAHYQAALRADKDNADNETQAREAAIISLGDAKTARQAYMKSYLTQGQSESIDALQDSFFSRHQCAMMWFLSSIILGFGELEFGHSPLFTPLFILVLIGEFVVMPLYFRRDDERAALIVPILGYAILGLYCIGNFPFNLMEGRDWTEQGFQLFIPLCFLWMSKSYAKTRSKLRHTSIHEPLRKA
jgi:hypothetical protein